MQQEAYYRKTSLLGSGSPSSELFPFFELLSKVITFSTRFALKCKLIKIFAITNCLHFVHDLCSNDTQIPPSTSIPSVKGNRIVTPQTYFLFGTLGSVDALCYKPEDRGFDSRLGNWIFQFTSTQSFQQYYGPGIDSAPNRNEYQNLPAGKGRQVHKADNFSAICEPIV
jgi:hypothetical protein